MTATTMNTLGARRPITGSPPGQAGRRRGRWWLVAACLLAWSAPGATTTANPAVATGGAAEREWTAADGRTVRGKLLGFDGTVVRLEVNGREFALPVERLSEADRRWLRSWQEGDGRAAQPGGADADGVERAELRLPRLPVRDWPLRDGTVLRGRLAGVAGAEVLIDVGGGADGGGLRRVDRGRELTVASQGYLREWTRFGPLEREHPAGDEAGALRDLGLDAWRYWRSEARNPEPGGSLPFQWFTPAIEPGRSYPLVVFLHGIGEAGNDNVRQLRHRDPLVFIEPAAQRRYPAFFMAPQHPAERNWAHVNVETPGRYQELVVQAIRRMMVIEHGGEIDPRRIYITGLSSGGLGAVQMCALYPDMFAAAVPISSRAQVAWFSGREVPPMWFFYNRGDDRSLVDGIERFRRDLPAGQPRPRVTRFDGGGHNAWREAYDRGGLARWLFAQGRTF